MVPEVIVLPMDGRTKLAGWGEQGNQVRDWQIEEFLRQTGKAENTQRVYRGQLQRFAAWSQKAWLEVTPSDVGLYRQGLKEQGLKTTSVNHAINTLKSFYGWLRRSNGFPAGQPLPTDAIALEREAEPQALHLDEEELERVWEVLDLGEKTRVRDRAIIAVLSHGLRASEASALNVGDWNGKLLTVVRSKGQNVSEVPLSREARGYLESYLKWRRLEGGVFEVTPESPSACQIGRHCWTALLVWIEALSWTITVAMPVRWRGLPANP